MRVGDETHIQVFIENDLTYATQLCLNNTQHAVHAYNPPL